MKWLNKLERKFGRYAIPNMMLYIIATMAVVFVLDQVALSNGISLFGWLTLERGYIFAGQVWRLITFLFIPSGGSPFGVILSLYFLYIVSTALEDAWGSFAFNVYYITGALMAILTMVLLGYGTNQYLNLTLFLAFAAIYPDREFLIFFVLPVKAKYIALLDWLIFIGSFVNALFGRDWGAALSIVLALFNFFLYFGGDLWRQLRNQLSWWKTRRNFRRKNRDDIDYY